jgi:hypothetical protein
MQYVLHTFTCPHCAVAPKGNNGFSVLQNFTTHSNAALELLLGTTVKVHIPWDQACPDCSSTVSPSSAERIHQHHVNAVKDLRRLFEEVEEQYKAVGMDYHFTSMPARAKTAYEKDAQGAHQQFAAHSTIPFPEDPSWKPWIEIHDTLEEAEGILKQDNVDEEGLDQVRRKLTFVRTSFHRIVSLLCELMDGVQQIKIAGFRADGKEIGRHRRRTLPNRALIARNAMWKRWMEKCGFDDEEEE